MKRIRALNGYQKGVLVVMLAMIVLFAILYAVTIHRVGYRYQETILVPSEQSGETVYQGKIDGKAAQFTVSADKTVVFQYGDKTYGPYTAVEDPTAVPEDDQNADRMTGLEVRCGRKLVFRGGVVDLGERRLLFNEDGSSYGGVVYYVLNGSDVTVDQYGNEVDPMEPSVFQLLELMEGPKLTHKGEWSVWFCAVVLCIVTAGSILFVDELFRLDLWFRIRNVQDAEPSEWEIMGRYVGWTVMPLGALIMFLVGLQ